MGTRVKREENTKGLPFGGGEKRGGGPCFGRKGGQVCVCENQKRRKMNEREDEESAGSGRNLPQGGEKGGEGRL